MARNRITQAELASTLGLSQSAISRRLNGESEWTANELVALARMFGISLSALFEGFDRAAS